MTHIITIAGASASGKTTLATQLQVWLDTHYKSQVCEIIAQDSYYHDLSHLEFEERAAVNFDHPNSLDHQFLYQQLSELKNGHAVKVPNYCYKTHQRTEELKTTHPLPFVIVEGIHTNFDQQIVDLCDYRIFVKTDLDICLARRIHRDIHERGRTVDSVINQYVTTVKPMYEKYAAPKESVADIVIDGSISINEMREQAISHPKFQKLIKQT
ncbi:MAG: uridine kinase [Gammaproteobacteria bacterium]|nr:uridine kinase [Gammaproteobacteria bacterium]MDH5628568.1 uridine kinase [Gammaproteobacteria bacterium]